MSHLDEGRLHALLDGELAPAELTEVEAHLATCGECRRLRDEARQFLAQADELIATLEPPGPERARAGTAVSPAAARWARWRNLAWAASVVLAVGFGWYANGLRFARPAATPDVGGRTLPVAPAPASRLAESSTAATATGANRQLHDAAETPARPQQGPAEKQEPKSEALQVTPTAPGALAKAGAPEPPPAQRSDEVKPVEPAAVQGLVRDQAAKPPEAAPVAATAPAAPPVAGLAARARPEGRLAKEEDATDLREITMVEAVRVLGGTIRLIDGATPRRILLGHHLIPGADSGQAVRVVYEDPPARELWLDQQPGVMPGSRGEAAQAARRVTQWLPGDTLVGLTSGGRQNLRWADQHGFLLALSGYLPADSLRSLARRVH